MTTFDIICTAAECCLAFFGALLASLAITPVVRSRAEEWGFVDRPDGGRKAHRRATALGGGVAVLVSALLAAGVTFSAISARHVAIEQTIVERFAAGVAEEEIAPDVSRADRAVDVNEVRKVLADYRADPDAFQRKYSTLLGKIARTSPFYFGLLAAVLLICGVGLLDDFVQLPGRYKLAGQVVAALILIASGLAIERIALFDRAYLLGILAVPFTLFWLLGAINAINLLDGVDGLASSVGFILALTLAILALFMPQAHEAEAVIALVLAGALLGFLRFNFAPATIFLGDSGSMLIGLVIGAIAIRCSLKETATVALAVPFALWAVPIFDSLAAIVRRKLTGRSLFATDRGHLHHSLLVRGWSVPQTVLFIGVICATTCLGALLSFFFHKELIAWLTVAGVVTFLILMGIFGHVELALVKDRVRSTTRAFSHHRNGAGKRVHESHIHLQGSQEWDQLWTALTESAEDYHLTRIELTLNLPALHEAFYANWACATTTDAGSVWRLACPLRLGTQVVGNLVVMGLSPEPSSLNHVGQVADFLEPVEEGICRVVAEISQRGNRLSQAEPGVPSGLPEGDGPEAPHVLESNEPIPSK